MQAQHKYTNNQNLLTQLTHNFKHLYQENHQLKTKLAAKGPLSPSEISKNTPQRFSKDQQKILKLYSYKTWHEFMSWIDEKLQESGQTMSNSESDQQGNEIKRVLSQILEQPDFEQSYTLDKTCQINDSKDGDSQIEMEMMAMQNGKLRKQNIELKGKLAEIRALYMKNYES